MLDAGMNTFAAVRFRPRLLNWLHASFAVGTTLGSLLMTALLSVERTWRMGFGLVAGVYLLLAVVFALTRDRWTLPHQDLTAVAPPQSNVRSRDTLKLPIVWISIIIFALYTGTELGLGQWIFTLATESRGISETTAGLWTTLYWGSLTAGRIILGFIETNTERLVRVVLLLVVAGAALFALDLGAGISLLGLMLVGFGLAPVFPALIALTPTRIGADHAPNAIGFQVGSAGIGAAVLPGLAGVLGEAIGLEVIALFFAGAAVLLFLTQEVAARYAKTRPAAG
jgi:fucose permease